MSLLKWLVIFYLIFFVVSCTVGVLYDLPGITRSAISTGLGSTFGQKTETPPTVTGTLVFPKIARLSLDPHVQGADVTSARALAALGNVLEKAQVIHGGYIGQSLPLQDILSILARENQQWRDEHEASISVQDIKTLFRERHGQLHAQARAMFAFRNDLASWNQTYYYSLSDQKSYPEKIWAWITGARQRQKEEEAASRLYNIPSRMENTMQQALNHLHVARVAFTKLESQFRIVYHRINYQVRPEIARAVEHFGRDADALQRQEVAEKKKKKNEEEGKKKKEKK